MFECKGTEKFDIGAGFGEFEYDFFTINDKEDFWALIGHYGFTYKQFNFFLYGYTITENNEKLSPFVQVKMKEHNANISLTYFIDEHNESEINISKLIVNELKSNGNYDTYFFNFLQNWNDISYYN